MTEKYSLFSYKRGSSFLHKCPSWIKILFIPIVNIFFLCLPPYFSFALILIQTIVAFSLRFTLCEQLNDLKPVIYYAFLLFFFQIISILISVGFGENKAIFDAEKTFLQNLKNQFAESFSWKNQKETVFQLLKLFAVMQSASLLFKTSTSLEIRIGIEKIERAIRKFFHLNNKCTFTNAISLFLNFIPMVSRIWNETKIAWFNRGGKANLKMYMTILPILFSVGMKKAYNEARALEIRN